MATSKKTPQKYSSTSQTSQSTTQQQSQTSKTLNAELMNQILAGLQGGMTDEEIAAFAENLMKPQLNAGLEAAQQQYETTRLGKEQEIENLAAELERSIREQNAAYGKRAAQVDAQALSRGMGRSSYTLQTLANQGTALAEAVRQLTDENARRSGQLQDQITQAAAQNAQTQGRLKTDYAANLAAKIQELRQNQLDQRNSYYMTAVSEALGSATTNNSTTNGKNTSNTTTGAYTSGDSSSGSGGGSGSSGGKKPTSSTTTSRPPATTTINVAQGNGHGGGGGAAFGQQNTAMQR